MTDPGPSNMKVLIFGANGMLGSYVFNQLSITMHVEGVTRKEFDIFTGDLTKFISTKSVNIIINCAGIIPQRIVKHPVQLDKKQHEMLYVNAVFPNLLHQYCQQHSLRLIHITTDCVFSGKRGNYSEIDPHDAGDLYGLSKSCGERHQGQIIRTSIIGEEVSNKVSLLEWVRSNPKGSTVNGFVDHHWNGVTCHQLALTIEKIIQEDIIWSGVRHIMSPTSVNKYQLVSMIDQIYNCGLIINSHHTDIVNKTMTSKYTTSLTFKIPELEQQIILQKGIKL